MTCSSLSADQGGSDHLSIGKHHLQGLCLNRNRLQSSFLQFYKKKRQNNRWPGPDSGNEVQALDTTPQIPAHRNQDPSWYNHDHCIGDHDCHDRWLDGDYHDKQSIFNSPGTSGWIWTSVSACSKRSVVPGHVANDDHDDNNNDFFISWWPWSW